MKQMAKREPLAWLPDDRYVYDLTWTEIAKIIVGCILAVVVVWAFLIGLLTVGQL